MAKKETVTRVLYNVNFDLKRKIFSLILCFFIVEQQTSIIDRLQSNSEVGLWIISPRSTKWVFTKFTTLTPPNWNVSLKFHQMCETLAQKYRQNKKFLNQKNIQDNESKGHWMKFFLCKRHSYWSRYTKTVFSLVGSKLNHKKRNYIKMCLHINWSRKWNNKSLKSASPHTTTFPYETKKFTFSAEINKKKLKEKRAPENGISQFECMYVWWRVSETINLRNEKENHKNCYQILYTLIDLSIEHNN